MHNAFGLVCEYDLTRHALVLEGVSVAPVKSHINLQIDQTIIAVRIRQNKRAKRLILRINPQNNEPVLTVPNSIPEQKVQDFLKKNTAWIQNQRAKMPDPVQIKHGASLPIRGIQHKISNKQNIKGTVNLIQNSTENKLIISGQPQHLKRRLTDWLKNQAKIDLQKAVNYHADNLQVKPAAIRIKDTKSQWGSCSSKRVLAFSWRLIMAPPFVLDYVAAHEVAHLRQMDHSKKFWDLVKQTCPQYQNAKIWLKKNGTQLHRYAPK